MLVIFLWLVILVNVTNYKRLQTISYVSLFAVLANLPLSYTRHGVSFSQFFFFPYEVGCFLLSFRPHTFSFSFLSTYISPAIRVFVSLLVSANTKMRVCMFFFFFVFHLDLVPAMRVDLNEVTVCSCDLSQ